MSHVVKMKVKVTNLEIMEKVCERMGGTFLRDQKTYRWYNSWQDDYSAEDAAYRQGVDVKDYGKCLHALSFKGCKYDVGLIAAQDGNGYELIYDVWDKSLAAKMGAEAKFFEAAYAIEGFIYAANESAYDVVETVNEQGEVVLTATESVYA